jgi:hypothetical protein
MNEMEENEENFRGMDYIPELMDVEMVFEISRVELHYIIRLLELITSYLSRWRT